MQTHLIHYFIVAVVVEIGVELSTLVVVVFVHANSITQFVYQLHSWIFVYLNLALDFFVFFGIVINLLLYNREP